MPANSFDGPHIFRLAEWVRFVGAAHIKASLSGVMIITSTWRALTASTMPRPRLVSHFMTRIVPKLIDAVALNRPRSSLPLLQKQSKHALKRQGARCGTVYKRHPRGPRQLRHASKALCTLRDYAPSARPSSSDIFILAAVFCTMPGVTRPSSFMD